ncbi:hypothetical protein Cgig2_009889 [Carnegiea gigantea]|uniref:Uncharacterized protein n=1 Tax=Carnegiea gigantea TaxID=171969 RepID=A0A9Q1K9E4_9CARY|nr:hypothetical protein Cgig2_009889 [Carnegiea gigantea]
MSTMTDTIMQQVKKVIEDATSARPLPHFDYVPTIGCRPSHRHVSIVSRRHSDEGREAARPGRNNRSQGEHRDWNILMEAKEHPMLRRLPPMISPPKPHNAQKYRELHEQNGHTTAECRELRKALYELECEPARPNPREEDCSTEIVATIVGGYAKGITQFAWKAQLRGAQ